MDRRTLNIGWIKLLVEAIVLLVIGAIVFFFAIIVGSREPIGEHGELRCEGSGAVVITINGKDYAVNGMASGRYPPIQVIWNNATVPESNFDRLIARGLTLCDW